MRKAVSEAAGAACAVLLGHAASAQQVLQPDELFERVSPSVWTVKTFDADGRGLAFGSAVVIGPGQLVTNCHVLSKAKSMAVTHENVSYGATLEAPDPERDLCILKVKNFTAPAVPVANAEDAKVGSRVYAIGSPRGLEQTISDGLLSGVRKSNDGTFTALQVTVPISPGSSGGGLFDAHGRLLGITSFQLRESQNLNFAVPATWIAEVPERARAALAARKEKQTKAVASAGTARTYEYQLRDRLTGNVRTVTYRLDRVDGDRLVFNQGSRIEKAGGGVISMSGPIGGEFDLAMPPGGWVPSEPKAGATWSAKYSSGASGQVVDMDVQAQAFGESKMRVKDRDLRVIQVEFTGYTVRNNGLASNPPGHYKATAWYSPELGRVVRFEAATRGGLGGGAFYIDEELELVDIRDD